ncbi:prolyl oligopeptidase family serine peptidase, partial [Myxococcota bacterium]|nr:prolyl oligopeptidase family serine peptidase [Myxococcota bacterium]
IVRNPERFRCAAALAGVTDIALQFSTADYSQDQAFRKAFEQLVGDPVSEYEAMKDLSPVFLVEKIQVPVFIAHGELDSRVTLEHSMRLKAMLDLHDRPYEWMVLPGEGHGFSTQRAARSYYAKLMNFLADHLQDPFFEPVTGPTVFCGNKEQSRYKQRIYQSILKALHTDEMLSQPGSGVAGLSFWLNEEGGIRKRSVGRFQGKPVGDKLERAVDSLGPFGPPPGEASCWSNPVLQSFDVLGPDASADL